MIKAQHHKRCTCTPCARWKTYAEPASSLVSADATALLSPMCHSVGNEAPGGHGAAAPGPRRLCPASCRRAGLRAARLDCPLIASTTVRRWETSQQPSECANFVIFAGSLRRTTTS